MSPVEIGVLVAACVCGLVTLYGMFRFLVAAFRESLLWGLGVLLLPFVQLIFLVVHWRTAARPFAIMGTGSLCAIALAIVGPNLIAASNPESALADAAETVASALPGDLAQPGASVGERFAKGEIEGCPDGALLTGARPPEGRELWCELGDGTRHGPYAAWHENRLRATAGEYRDGMRTGQWLRWSQYGELESTAMFENDLQHGPMVRYDERGQVVSETIWQYGEIASN